MVGGRLGNVGDSAGGGESPLLEEGDTIVGKAGGASGGRGSRPGASRSPLCEAVPAHAPRIIENPIRSIQSIRRSPEVTMKRTVKSHEQIIWPDPERQGDLAMRPRLKVPYVVTHTSGQDLDLHIPTLSTHTFFPLMSYLNRLLATSTCVVCTLPADTCVPCLLQITLCTSPEDTYPTFRCIFHCMCTV